MIIKLEDALKINQDQNINLYKKHINPGLSKAYSIFGYNDFEISSAEGSWLNLKNNKKILDLTSSLGVVNLGHNNPRIIEAENFFNSQKFIDCQKFGVNKLQSVLANNISKILNNNLTMSFFGTSGAEANEAGLKLSMAFNKGSKKKFITFSNSYHGKTLNSLSLTNVPDFQDSFVLGLEKENIINLKFNDIVGLEDCVDRHYSDINAIIIEPIQGQTMEVASICFMKKIELLCKKHNILLFVDEIKCGLARAREIFYYKNYNIKADILTISKSLGGGKNAISAMICDKEVFHKAYGSINRSNIHTTTFFGLGKACASAIKTLEILNEDSFKKKLHEKTIAVNKKLLELKEKYPKIIKSIKGDGLFIGIDFNSDFYLRLKLNEKLDNTLQAIIMAAIVRYLLDHFNILMHFEKSNPSFLKFMPCLNINEEELNFFFKNFEEFLKSVNKKIFINFIFKNIKNFKELL